MLNNKNNNEQPFSFEFQNQLVYVLATRNPAGIKQTIFQLLEQYQKTLPGGKSVATDPIVIDCTALLLLLCTAEKEVKNWEIEYTSHSLN